MTCRKSIRPDNKPAGNWGALKAICEALVTPDLFATYSVTELSEWSDYTTGAARPAHSPPGV
jgi:hypothetical protein